MDEPFVIQSGREIRTVDDWLRYAGPKEGKAQWAHGYSAMESARAWLRTGKPAVPDELAPSSRVASRPPTSTLSTRSPSSSPA